MHGLKQAFLTTGLNLKIPSIPAGGQEQSGYSFEDESHTRGSYFSMLETMSWIGEQGCQLPLDVWKVCFFVLKNSNK